MRKYGTANSRDIKGHSAAPQPPLIEKAAQWLADYRLPLAMAMLLAALIFGYVGHMKYFSTLGRQDVPWNDLYYTLRLFVPTATPLEGEINLELQVARILALVAGFYIAAEALLSIFRDQIQILRLRLFKDHVVICGLGQKGLLLADLYRTFGEPVVIIESDENNTMIGHCKDRGAVVLSGNAADPQLLQKAQVHRARVIISTCGSDSTNAEIALYARQLTGDRKGKALSCLVHIFDLKLWELLKEHEIRMGTYEAFRLGFFNIYESGARVLLYKYPPFTHATSEGLYSHIVVIGLGRLGECLVTCAARMWRNRSGEGGRMRITLIDSNARARKDSLCLRYPQLDKVCELLPIDIDVESREFERGSFFHRKDGSCDVSAVYITLGNESLGLTAASRLLRLSLPADVPVAVRMNRSNGLAHLFTGIAPAYADSGNLHAFPLLEETCTPELIAGGATYEILARAIHEDYTRKAEARSETPGTNRSMVPWEKLPENLRESNRNQAEHMSEKLHLFGYDIVMTPDWDLKALELPADTVELMARLEHTRFVAERLHQGWKLGSPKDEEKKISPTLIPYDDLSDEEKEKDRTTVMAIPAFLVMAGFQVILK